MSLRQKTLLIVGLTLAGLAAALTVSTQSNLLQSHVALAAAGLILAAVTVLLVERLVIARLARLSRSVNAIALNGDPAARVTAGGRDEVATLAGHVNGMLDAIGQSRYELGESEQKYRTLFEQMTSAFALHQLVVDERGEPVDWVFLEVNPEFERNTGLSREAVIGKRVSQVFPEMLTPEWLDPFARAALMGEKVHFEQQAGPLGQWFSVTAYRTKPGQFVSIFHDVTARRRMEETLRESEQRFQDVARHARAWVWETDVHGLYTYSNRAVIDLVGYKPDEVIGHRHFYDFSPEEDREAMRKIGAAYFKARQAFQGEVRRAVHKDGRIVWLQSSGSPLIDAGGVLRGYRGAAIDITELMLARQTLEEANRRLDALATTDELTGLVNRRRIHELIEAEALRAARYGSPLALVMIDVDRFKGINDSFGHVFGDRAMIQVADTLRREARATDVVARYAGDEFLILMPGVTAEQAAAAAERLRGAVASQSVVDGDWTAKVTISLGLSEAPAGGAHADALVRQADEALSAAKQAGRNCFRNWNDIAHDRGIDLGPAAVEVENLQNDLESLSEKAHDVFAQSIASLVHALEARDHYTKCHSDHVAIYGTGIAAALGLPPAEIEVIRRAAAVHDIGKIGVCDSILRKRGPLTEAEWRLMQQHVLVGVRILDHLHLMERELPLVRYHHERWDGCGYPHGIAGEAIPLGARILAAADALDALTSDRVYRRAVSLTDALDVLATDAGRHFDPKVIDALMQWVGDVGRLNGDADPTAADLLATAQMEPAEATL